jgi:hypothetical protein
MTSTAVRPRLIGGVAAAATVATAALIGAWAPTAGAHDGGAVIEVDTAHDIPGGVHFTLEVTWEDDGHPAAGATVTATAEGPDGGSAGPVPFEEDAEGVYEGTVEMEEPGDWTVTFAALGPDGTLDHTHPVVGEADEADGEEAAGDGVTEETEVTEPEVVSPDADPEVLSVEDADSDDDSPSVVLLVLVFVLLAAVVAGAFWLVMSRRQGGDGAGAAADDTADGGSDEAAASSSEEAADKD